jgi:hypothetical protein
MIQERANFLASLKVTILAEINIPVLNARRRSIIVMVRPFNAKNSKDTLII